MIKTLILKLLKNVTKINLSLCLFVFWPVSLVKCVCIMYLCSCSSFQFLTIVRSAVHRSVDSHLQ